MSDSRIRDIVNKLDNNTLDRMNIIIKDVLIQREQENLMSTRYAQTRHKQPYYNNQQQVQQTERIHSTQKNKYINAKLRFEEFIRTNGCVIYVREGCPHCEGAIKLLDKLHAKYKLIPITRPDIPRETALWCFTLKTENSFPAIFIGGIFIGGNTDLQRLGEQKLMELLTQNNAITRLR
jgi:glutaredoxin